MAGFGIRVNSNSPTTVLGKVASSLFFALFLGAGLFFLGLLLREERAALRTWTWTKTPCQILSSAVREGDAHGGHTGNFRFEVAYQYRFGGQSFTSDRYKRSSQTFSDYRKAARLVEQFPSESTATCYVNPRDPEESVLQRDNFYLLPFIFLPLIFVAIGGGAIYFTWRSKPAPDPSSQPISERASMAKGQRFLILFCLVFLLVGCGLLYGFFLRPVFDIVTARSWPAVPCVVLSSEVQTHSSSDGDTYSVNIFYRYEVKGQEFRSNRYHFMGGSSSGYGSKQAVVNRYPPGTHTVCYVNPVDPTEAVLERSFTRDLWFGLIPLAFVLFGGGMLYGIFRKARQSESPLGASRSLSASSSARTGPGAFPAERATGSVVLKPKTAPWAKLLGVTFAAAFWNGIVSVFLMDVVHGWRVGQGEWFLTLFLVPFVLIGLGLIAAIGYFLLALFNPRPRLRVTPGAVPLGGELRVEWELAGRTGVLQKLELRLQGREEAQYRRGTNTATDTNVFADIELATLTNPYEMRSGTCTVTIPENLMHSFVAKNNRIIWSLRLHGDIPRWPDINEEFPFTVVPAVRKAKEVL